MAKLDFTEPIDPGSRAWCSNCSWMAWGSRSHVKAKAHNEAEQHLIHLFEPDPVPLYPPAETVGDNS